MSVATFHASIYDTRDRVISARSSSFVGAARQSSAVTFQNDRERKREGTKSDVMRWSGNER